MINGGLALAALRCNSLGGAGIIPYLTFFLCDIESLFRLEYKTTCTCVATQYVLMGAFIPKMNNYND